ncbi:MAG: YegS/Rv2252/BmrU family lipid kinase [Firmicutes bacterium]|nr:YegS/Rv2252/BmrU family lipid kinase [Bacillota bacterium]
MRPRIRLIYNPTAGKELFRHRLPEVLRILETAGLEASCHATTGARDATNEAVRAAQDGFLYVVACGGDGTVNEVINGLARVPTDRRPTLGIIPAGTTNDLARALKLPFQIEEAARLIAAGVTMPLDLGRIGRDHYFVNIAGCGRLTEITYDVPSRMKTMLGQLAYVMRGLERLPGLRPIHLQLRSSSHGEADYEYDHQAMLCLITNSRSVGGFERIAPRASVHDGKLDVLIIKPTHLANLLRIATIALRGEHVQDEHVLYFHAQRIELSSREQVDVNIDGEYGGRLPTVVQVMPNHLSVLVRSPLS